MPLWGLSRCLGGLSRHTRTQKCVVSRTPPSVPHATSVPIMLVWGTHSWGLQQPQVQSIAALPPTLGGIPPSLSPGGISMFPAWETALMSGHLK